MPEQIAVTPGQTAQTTPEPGKQPGSAAAATASTEAGTPLTLEKFNELLAARDNALFANVRRLVDGKAPANSHQPAAGTTATQADSSKADDKPLKDQFAEFRAERDLERKALADERKEVAIDRSINALGLADDDAYMFRALFNQEFGARIRVEGKEVFLEAEDLSRKSVKDLVGDLFAKHGKRFTPAKELPGGVGLSAARGSTASNGKHPFSSLTYKQIMDHPDFSLREQYFKSHPDEWKAKKTAR